jgi:hypothetical protein
MGDSDSYCSSKKEHSCPSNKDRYSKALNEEALGFADLKKKTPLKAARS